MNYTLFKCAYPAQKRELFYLFFGVKDSNVNTTYEVHRSSCGKKNLLTIGFYCMLYVWFITKKTILIDSYKTMKYKSWLDIRI